MGSTMSPSRKGSKKPAVALSKVPSIKELCERLGFQHASLKDTNAFTDATHAWRKSYKTSGGTPGTELLLWNQLSVQSDLTIMAERFLEDRENGDRFWSPARSWNHDSDVQYPEDRARIIELLKQLFWKQNRYAANNNAHSHKIIESRDASRDKTTPVAEVTGKIPPTSTSPKNQHQARRGAAAQGAAESPPSRTWPPLPSLKRKDPAIQIVNDHHVTGHGEGGLRPSVETDIFEVPDDDESATIAFPEPSTPKRVGTQKAVTSRDNKSRKKKPDSPGEPRRTDRKREPRNRPGIVAYTSDDMFDQIFKTPPPPESDTPHLSQGSDQERTKGISGNPNDIHETTPESSTMPSVPSFHNPSLKPFAAPTAPMIDFNEAEESEDQLRTLTEPFQHITSPEQLHKAQNSPSKPHEQLSKVVRLQMKGKHTPGPELASEIQSNSAPMRPHLPKQPTSPALAGHNGVQLSKSASSSSLPESQTDKKSFDSAIRPDAGVANVAATESKSGGNDGAFRPSLTPQPVYGIKRNTPSDHDPLIPLSPDKRVKRTVMVDVGREEMPQSHPQSLQTPQPDKSSSTENVSSKPRSKIQVPLWIITREPRFTEERWDDGKFLGTKLTDFLEDLSKATQRKHIEKVKLTLRTPTFDTKITVLKDAEDLWISAKEKFVEKLKEATAEAKMKRPNETPSFEILVEPFYEESAMMAGNADEDDQEFEF